MSFHSQWLDFVPRTATEATDKTLKRTSVGSVSPDTCRSQDEFGEKPRKVVFEIPDGGGRVTMVEDDLPVDGVIRWFEATGYTPRKNSLGWTVWVPPAADPSTMDMPTITREIDRLPHALRQALLAKAEELEDSGCEMGLPAGRAALAWVWGME